MARIPKSQTKQLSFRDLPQQQHVAAIRYGLNWQSTALQLQFDRLTAWAASSKNHDPMYAREFMSFRIDMDFFVITVRRILRLANQAKRSGLDTKGDLKPIVKDFEHRWLHVIDARNALEHIDEPKASRALLPMSSSDGKIVFLMPGKSIDIGDLFLDVKNLCRAIDVVIRSHESGPLF